MAASELPGIYKVPAYRARGRGIATHKAPTAPYRGVSRPQIVLVMERLMEKAARELRLDPLDVRRLNMIGPGEFPYAGVNLITYDEGSYRESLDLAEQRVASAGRPAERDRLRAEGLRAGIGYTCFSERTAYGTPTMSLRRMRMTPGYDTASVRMDPTGEVIVTTGTPRTARARDQFAQIVADRLGVHPDQVRLRQGRHRPGLLRLGDVRQPVDRDRRRRRRRGPRSRSRTSSARQRRTCSRPAPPTWTCARARPDPGRRARGDTAGRDRPGGPLPDAPPA